MRLFAFPSVPDASVRFAGGERFIYRLTMTTSAYAEHAWPLAVRRGKAMTTSALDALAGVGPVRRKRLLNAFGSVAALRRAGVDEIAAVKGMTPALAADIKTALARRGDNP